MKNRRRPPLLDALEPRILLTANTVIDLLALYTPQAETAAGGQINMWHQIEGAVGVSNGVLANSQIPVIIRLVGMTLVNYTESGNLSADLARLRNPTDGYMDNVQAMRNWLGADLVTLFTSTGTTSGSGEQNVGEAAQIFNPTGPGNSEIAYSVVAEGAAGAPNYTLIHEIGHNLGATHAVGDPTAVGATAYAHGYRFTGMNGVLYHDVMAYDPGQEIPYFSNPRIAVAGVPEGNAATADAARVVTQDAPIVASYRTLRPVGALDIHDGGLIGGWAYDPASPQSNTKVILYVDGAPVLRTAAYERPDLDDVLGGGFGFYMTLPSGTHHVVAYAQSITGQLGFIGALTVTNTLPTGRLEFLSPSLITGWARDTDTTGPIRVNLVIDGTTDFPTTLSTVADTFRPDLQNALGGSGKFGFSFTLGPLSAGIHRIDVYAVDNAGNVVVLLGTRSIDSNQLPVGNVDVFNATTIAGWALDPNDNQDSDPVQIRYTIDNNAPQLVTASLSRTDLLNTFHTEDHGFSIALPALSAGSHTISVDAVDFDTQAFVLLAKKTIVVTPPAGDQLPIGFLDIASSGRIAGWAYDPDVGANPIQVAIAIDGAMGSPVTANVSRSDLVRLYGTDRLGFDLRNLGLSGGPHRIDLYAIDNDPSATPVLIASKIINDIGPVGTISGFSWQDVRGTASVQNAASQEVRIRVDVDGLIDGAVTADGHDLDPNLSNNHSFDFPLSLTPGTHQITVWMIDPSTDDPVLLDSGKVVAPH